MSRTLDLVRGVLRPKDAAQSPGEKPRPRVLVAIPSGDRVHANFAMALATMLYLAGAMRVPLALANNKGSCVHKNRNNAVSEAHRLESSKILFIDSDMTFPPNALERLLAHEKPIVGASYASRGEPHHNLAKSLSTEYTPVKGLTEVAGLPAGMLLIDVAVFESLKRPYFRFPFVEEDPAQGVEASEIGEDYDFCNRVRAAGFKVFMDVELSLDMIHWGEAGWRLNESAAVDQPDAHLVEVSTSAPA